jgi:hypothetical protein
MPRNPSELQRLEEEREDILTMLRTNRIPPHNKNADKGLKAAKEALIGELRLIERQLGITSHPYNSDKFGSR